MFWCVLFAGGFGYEVVHSLLFDFYGGDEFRVYD